VRRVESNAGEAGLGRRHPQPAGKFCQALGRGGLSGRAFAARVGGLWGTLLKELSFYLTSLLVTRGRAFYNPSITALETEVQSYAFHPGAQLSKETVVYSVSECLNIDLYFGSSQEY